MSDYVVKNDVEAVICKRKTITHKQCEFIEEFEKIKKKLKDNGALGMFLVTLDGYKSIDINAFISPTYGKYLLMGIEAATLCVYKQFSDACKDPSFDVGPFEMKDKIVAPDNIDDSYINLDNAIPFNSEGIDKLKEFLARNAPEAFEGSKNDPLWDKLKQDLKEKGYFDD